MSGQEWQDIPSDSEDEKAEHLRIYILEDAKENAERALLGLPPIGSPENQDLLDREISDGVKADMEIEKRKAFVELKLKEEQARKKQALVQQRRRSQYYLKLAVLAMEGYGSESDSGTDGPY